uniref:CSON000834 protein n=1 Tax=Culicoides sonorensis TaxID=179676 RepID=A0A336MFX5_CULSO
MSHSRKVIQIIFVFLILASFGSLIWSEILDANETPEGYYAFIESRNAIPPKVRQPPYVQIPEDCPQADSKDVSIYNFCGDLNVGTIPKNPMNQSVLGEPYPFELIRNHTLKFLSKALPALKADGTLPKVTEIFQEQMMDGQYNNRIKRQKRDTEEKVEVENRQNKRFCEDGTGIFCTIYRAISGDTKPEQISAERRDEIVNRYDSPPTPCPAKVEYVTPIYARSYLGSWRYVVQIPYEGYFTQTVEVTKCLQVRCYYLDGGCLSTPRWVSLLVAEIFYPNKVQPPVSTTSAPVPPIHDFEAYQQYLQQRAEVPNELSTSTEKIPEAPVQCDGYDNIGCYQIRLYYDWFLIPGSCKCWKPDYFSKYLRKRPATLDL